MIQILDDERQIMRHAEMMEGYSYETAGILEPTSLVPAVMSWLQAAPAPFRPTTSDGLESFALVRTVVEPKAFVAIWNTSDRKRDVVMELAGTNVDFDERRLLVLKGSGNAIAEQKATLRRNRVSGITLAPKELALVRIE